LFTSKILFSNRFFETVVVVVVCIIIIIFICIALLLISTTTRQKALLLKIFLLRRRRRRRRRRSRSLVYLLVDYRERERKEAQFFFKVTQKRVFFLLCFSLGNCEKPRKFLTSFLVFFSLTHKKQKRERREEKV